MKLAAEKGWANVSLAEIGEAAGLDFKELFTVAPSKTAILEALSRRADAAVLSEGPLDAGDGSRNHRASAALSFGDGAVPPVGAGRGEEHDIHDRVELGKCPLLIPGPVDPVVESEC